MDKLAEFEYANQLFEVYGKLLTPKQYKMMEQYYCFNLSLSEVAYNNNISRTAVADCLKKSLAKLNSFEQKLEILKTKRELEKQVDITKKNFSKENLEKLERMIKDGI